MDINNKTREQLIEELEALRRQITEFEKEKNERKEVEEALLERSRFIESLINLSPDIIYIYDLVEQKNVYSNDGIQKVLGYTVEDIRDMGSRVVPNLMHPDDLKVYLEETVSGYAKAKDNELISHGYRMKHKDGNWHWLESVELIYKRQADGKPHQIFGVIHDITGRRQAEEKLLEREAFIRLVLDNLPVGIAVNSVDPDVTFNYMNDSFPKFYRTTREKLADPDAFWETVYEDPEFREKIKKRVLDDCAGGDPARMYWVDVPITRKGEETAFITARNIPIPDKKLMISAVWDVTGQKLAEEEKEKLQAQLIQAQKMEAIGHLAGGVAHDFNNILSAIVGYAHLLLMKMKDDDPLRMNPEQILALSEKAANLTKDLLAFSRKQVMQIKNGNLNDIVFGMMKILERIIGEDIALQVNTAGHDLIVNVDINQIEQVLMNLTTNARDAMPGGGTLTITTEELEMDEKYVQMHHFAKAGKYAVLSVTDTGVGMDEKTKENIFDPFFTTKEVGKGTGLGLAMIYGTIKQHNGFINVYSEQGRGTTFRIYLPLVEPGVKVSELKMPAAVPSGTETILLVEDNEDVRSVTKALLEEFGYSVIEAADGQHAVKLFRENKDRIQLVITDIIMPGQSGKAVHDELKKITTDIKVLFISGYPADILAKKGIIDSDVDFISKPVNPETLLKKIREVLDR